jgi:UDP-glucose 4-epimerase
MTRALVTGGAGFIGSHVVDAFVERGLEVVVLDNLSTGNRENVNPAARFVEGNIGDPAALREAFARPVDIVDHHAAQMDIRVSVRDPAADAETNIVGSLRLLQAAVEHAASRFIFASSGGAGYGEPEFTPQTEEHPLRPLSPYGCAKVAVEMYLRFYRQTHGLRSVALRYANVYGPRQREDGEAGVVSIFGGRLLAGQQVTINGDGQQTRDYVVVDDVVRANMAALDARVDGAFNVGTGVETSVNELFALMRSIQGSPVEPLHAPAKDGEQRRSVLDGRRLRSLAGLPEPVDLRTGLESTLRWLSERRRHPEER